MTQRSVEQAGPSYLVQEPPNVNQYQQFPCFPVGGHFQFLPSGHPCSPAESTSSCGSLPSESTEAKSKRCSWSNPEVKCLISAYKQHHNLLKATRSAHGKKSVWESIMDEFIQLCREARIDTSKTSTTADPITDTEPGEDDNTKIKQPNQKKNPSGLQRKK